MSSQDCGAVALVPATMSELSDQYHEGIRLLHSNIRNLSFLVNTTSILYDPCRVDMTALGSECCVSCAQTDRQKPWMGKRNSFKKQMKYALYLQYLLNFFRGS